MVLSYVHRALWDKSKSCSITPRFRCHGCNGDFWYKYKIPQKCECVRARERAHIPAKMNGCQPVNVPHKYKPICIRFTGGYMSCIQNAERRRFNDILVSCSQRSNHDLTRFGSAKFPFLLSVSFRLCLPILLRESFDSPTPPIQFVPPYRWPISCNTTIQFNSITTVTFEPMLWLSFA